MNLEVCMIALNICIFYKDILEQQGKEAYRTKALLLLEEVAERLSIYPTSIPTVQKYWEYHEHYKNYFEGE